MSDKLNIFDLNRRKTAILQNAYNITETQELNKIYSLEFSIPANDEKAKFIQPFHYARYGETGELYRIIKSEVSEGDISELKVSCEHVIAILCDDLMFGEIQYGGSGISTRECIEYLLSQQKVKNWQLDECDFNRKFEYLWSQENILNALYSIPKEFSKSYKWVFDTTTYKWKLSLKTIDETVHPQFYIRAKRNLLNSGSSQEFSDICTRIYPLGYGEGVNQLGIAEVNNGVPYLQSPSNIIEQYGIKEKVLVDRRFESAESLKEYAQTMLNALQTPSSSRAFNVVDLYPITGEEIDNAKVGDICKLSEDGTITYITKTKRVLDDPGNLEIELSTKTTDVADTIADLADRVRIESVYAQGATQLYQHSKDANATSSKGMIMSLYFPSEMKQINKVILKIQLDKFRSYSSTTESETVTVNSCENKVVTVDTNSAELGGTKTTLDGGGTTSSSGGTSVTVGGGATSGQNTGNKTPSITVSASGSISAPTTTQTSSPNTNFTSGTVWTGDNSNFYTTALAYNQQTSGTTVTGYQFTNGPGSGSFEGHTHRMDYIPDHYHTSIPYGFQLSMKKNQFAHDHKIPHYHTVSISASASGGSHSHTFSVPDHTHTITAHSHNLPNLSHSHKITLNGHTHAITLNSHSHDITAGIFESGNASSFDIYVNGTRRETINSKSYEGDITSWLLDNKNQIPRDSWIKVEIRPNDLAYVISSVFVQGFVQSRGGGNY